MKIYINNVELITRIAPYFELIKSFFMYMKNHNNILI